MLRAAIDLFNRKGYDATSIGDVAEELGVTKSAVYHHVPSKEHLLSEALDEALTGSRRRCRRRAAADGSAYERLRGVVRHSVEVLVEHQPAVTLLLRVHGNSETEKAALAPPAPDRRPAGRAWSARPPARARCAPTSTPSWSAGCCSGW